MYLCNSLSPFSQIIDMGFSREHAEQALVSCNNDLAAATEWILTHPLPSSIAAAPSASSATATQPSVSPTGACNNEHCLLSNLQALSAGLSEEEQIARAIALSLGQAGSSSQSKKPDETAEKVEKVEEKPKEEKVVELAPIDESVLDSLSDKLLEGTLRVVSQVRDTVYSACDLITALSKRNGPQWREKAISRVKDEVNHPLTLTHIHPPTFTPTRSHTHSLTHSLTHLPTHSLTHSLTDCHYALTHSLLSLTATHSLTHSLTHRTLVCDSLTHSAAAGRDDQAGTLEPGAGGGGGGGGLLVEDHHSQKAVEQWMAWSSVFLLCLRKLFQPLLDNLQEREAVSLTILQACMHSSYRQLEQNAPQ